MEPNWNSTCPCGSRRPFRVCHGNKAYRESKGKTFPRDWFQFVAESSKAAHRGISVEEKRTGTKWTVGDAGTTVFAALITEGDVSALESRPGSHYMVINAEIPFFLPFEDGDFEVDTRTGKCVVTVNMRRRGEETFSSLNTTALPLFSSLKIRCNVVAADPVVVIQEALLYFEQVLHEIGENPPEMHKESRFSITVDFFDFTQGNKFVAKRTYPLTGTHVIPSEKAIVPKDVKLLAALNSVRLQLRTEATRTKEKICGESFLETVIRLFHDFAFFGSQHPAALQQLDEQTIRDLLLIPLKIQFSAAEGECFNFSGKADIKVTNPVNRYEYVIAELKWWEGVQSAKAIFSQAFREHSTGQENCVFGILLCKNRDQQSVRFQYIESLKLQPEFESFEPDLRLIESGEWFRGGYVNIHGKRVRLVLGIVNLFFENVRKTLS